MPRGGRLAAAAGGALAALALPAPGLWPLGWFGLVPLALAAQDEESPRGAAWAGFWSGAAYHAVVLHWVYDTCRFARIPVPVAAAAWLALAAFLALNWAAASALARALSDGAPRAARPWIWAACWTAVAFAAERWTPRLGVDLLAYTQWPNPALMQAGAWAGPHGLGFLLALFHGALAGAWRDAREGGASSVPALSAALALAAGVWAHGAFALLARPGHGGPSARIEILQPCVDQYRKWDRAHLDEVLAGYRELLARPRPAPPALVVWPETALPFWVSRRSAPPEVADAARATGAPQLAGIVAAEEEDAGPANAVVLVSTAGAVTGLYAKRELVPFGEFVPLRGLIPRFVVENWLKVLDNLGDLTPGAPDQPFFGLPWGRAAATICYEAMFPRWTRRDAARGASVIFNLTNDGWYKDTWAPRQHFQANRFRAVEARATVIRSGNTGISAVIDPWGVVTARLDLNERGRLDAQVPLADPFPARSPYARLGDWLGWSCLAAVALAAARRALA